MPSDPPAPTNPLYSWGYQSRRLVDLLSILERYKIGGLIDVRRVPFSKYQPEFCKDELKEAANGAGLWYVSAPHCFGNQSRTLPWDRPPDWEWGCQRATVDLAAVPVLLLCLERDPSLCHRAEVARAIQAICGCKIFHLGFKVPPPAPEQMGLF